MRLTRSLVALGLGAVAYNYARRNNMMSAKTMRRARRLIKSYL
ncbi:MAG: YrzQ family protein [Ectobacillus sp.]